MNRQTDVTGSDDARLDRVFQAYRAVCPDFDPSANFMPGLWKKIETRQSTTTVFGHLARNLMTAALALSAILALAVSFVPQPLPSDTYAEILTEHQVRETMSEFEPVRISPISDLH